MKPGLLFTHGGYRTLKSFQSATIVYDLTVDFCNRFITDYRLRDQMVHAARSGRQNIAEGCQASATSKKTELKLVNVARASLEELLVDYEDVLRQRGLLRWTKEDTRCIAVRQLAFLPNRTHKSYMAYWTNVENSANTALCVIHQTNYLLDKQLRALEQAFLTKGGSTERLYQQRVALR